MADDQRPVVLCVLDGVGEREGRDANAMKLAKTPALDALAGKHASATLDASGEAVGLADDQPGSGEVGYLTLAAGRVVEHDRARLDALVASNKLGRNEIVDQAIRICRYDDCPLHLFGLLSDGGVHASMDHLYALIDVADFNEVPVILHLFLDGHDSGPRSTSEPLRRLETRIEDKQATIGTVSGRYYAMDRNGRWDRSYQAFHAVVRDKALGPAAPRAESVFEALRLAYGKGLSDDMVEPTRIGDYDGFNGDFLCDFASEDPVWEWTGLDVGLAFNFRGDRMRQLSGLLARQAIPTEVIDDLLMDRDKPVLGFRKHCFATLTCYGDDFEVPVVLDKRAIEDTFGELLSRAGMKQLRCAESDIAHHVTRYFNGGREQPFDGEERQLIASSKLVDRPADKPAMKAKAVANAAVEAVASGEHDFILVAFANPDAVAHGGDLDATIAAVEAVDEAVERIAAAVRDAGGVLAITAPHGNCEEMITDGGDPHHAHTLHPVPFVLLDALHPDAKLRDGGQLADVAPTLLALLGLQQPPQMTGRSLLLTTSSKDADS